MPTTVKALQKTSPDAPFQVREIERRDPRPDDVVIDIKAAGICHSDIHKIRNEWGEAHFPLAVGHEVAGIVEAVGDAVTKHRVGDRVGVGVMVNSCGECEHCEAGLEQFCVKGVIEAYDSEDVDGTITQGGYSQKVVVPERFVLRIPEGIELDEAAPLLCAGITTYSPLARWNVGEGSRVAILGLGGLGHMGVQIAAAKGAEVTVLSRTLAKEQDAKALGAQRVLATSDPDFFTEHKGEFDLILNTISAQIELDDYVSLLAPKGVFAVVGLPPEAQSVHAKSLVGGSKAIVGSMIGSIAETQEMLDFCAEHGIGAKIERIGVDEVDAAHDRVVDGDVRFRFVIDTATFDDAEVQG